MEKTAAQKGKETQEKRLAWVKDLLSRKTDPDARKELVKLISKAIAYHDTGKIEGLFSLDTSCANNSFCPKMQKNADPACICDYCYTENMWDSAKFAHYITGFILSELELTEEEAAVVKVSGTLNRYNSDGELINHVHAVNLIRIARTHEGATFALWTKRPSILDRAIKQEGKPANLICGISSAFINTPFAERWTWLDFIFTVYTPRGMEEALKRGEHEFNGKKCKDCGYFCYHKHDGVQHIAEALRKPKKINKAAFPGIVEAIDRTTLD